MATYTPNIGLHQWVAGDKFLRTDFNEDFQKIDTAVGNKADQTDLDSLRSTVSGKASSSSVNSSITNLQNQINSKASTTSVNSSITNLQSQINSLDDDKAEFVSGVFVGVGGTISITLGFQPKLVLVSHRSYCGMANPDSENPMIAITSTGFTATYLSNYYNAPNQFDLVNTYFAMK